MISRIGRHLFRCGPSALREAEAVPRLDEYIVLREPQDRELEFDIPIAILQVLRYTSLSGKDRLYLPVPGSSGEWKMFVEGSISVSRQSSRIGGEGVEIHKRCMEGL